MKEIEDSVTDPQYYIAGGIEVWDFIYAHNLGYHVGNVIKYVTRYRYKNGLKDLYKARNYLNKVIEREEAILRKPIEQEKTSLKVLEEDVENG